MPKTTVELTQYMRPDGRKQPTTAEVELDAAVAAKVAEMALSCEVLVGGEVVLYARWSDQDDDEEEMAFAKNQPGPDQPDVVLAKLITKLAQTR